jgi:hypothetical protein
MLSKRLAEPPTAVKYPLRRPHSNAGWRLIERLAALKGYEPEPWHVRVFLDCVARAATRLERESLLAAGRPVFRYDLNEARARVETAYLERMHALDGGPSLRNSTH